MNARPDFNNPPLINQASVAHVRIRSENWSVLRHRTEPRTVAMMMDDMKASGYEAYLPQLIRRRRKMVQGKRETTAKWESEALFPGYVFVRPIDGPAPARPMTSVYGIEGRDAVGKVKPILVDRIRAHEQTVEGLTGWIPDAERRHVPAEEWRANLSAGAVVEIEACGTFLQAVVTANDGHGRLRALMDLFGRSTVITVNLVVRVRAATV